jgi:APA family basic amino acid/polyamine antiporter
MNFMSEHSFKKVLNLKDSTSIIIGSMIGSGIFIVSADMSRTLGAPGWLLAAWVITGILTVVAAVSYGELAAMFPRAGGQYVYLREAYNPLTGFLYGWTMFTVIQTGTIAAVGMAFGKFLSVLVPYFSENNILYDFGLFKLKAVHIPAIGSLLMLSLINTFGIKTGKIVQNTFTFTKIFVLLIIIALGFLLLSNSSAMQFNKEIFFNTDGLTLDTGSWKISGLLLLVIALGVSQVGSLFTCDAWNNITFASGEVIHPKRTIPLSLLIGTGIVVIIYVLVNVVYLQALPLRGTEDGINEIARGIQYADSGRVGTAAMSVILGSSAVLVMAVFVVWSTFGCNNGLILAGSRLFYAMAADGLFFKKIAKLNSRNVPAVAIWFQFFWASILCLSGTYSDLLDYVVFAVLIFYILTIAGIFILRKKQPEAERPYKAWGYPYLQIIYILITFTIMVVLLLFKPQYTWPGLIIVIIGIPVYYLWKKLKLKNTKSIENKNTK